VSLDLRIINHVDGFDLNVGWTTDNELLVRFSQVTLEKNIFFGTGGAASREAQKKPWK